MLQIKSLSKEYGERILFSDVTFSLNKGEKVGLVGRNGSGKSTLFKILMGMVESDQGEVAKPQGYSIGMLEQHLEFSKDSVLKECMQVLSADEQYDEYKAETILFGLGFNKENIHNAPKTFSGGFQIRINLAKLLLSQHDLLLLDEPTNYLDIVSIGWLENFLKQFSGEVILITHDRAFMNKVSTHTLGLHRQKMIKVKGNTDKYFLQLEEEERVYENTRLNQEKKKKEIETFVNKFRAKARQASLAQSRAKMLEKMEEFEKLENVQNLDFRFNTKEFNAKTFLEAKNISFGYSEDNLLFKNFSFYLNKGDRVAIIGKNGKGKSTLLNVLGEALSSNSGEIKYHPNTSMGHFGQTNIQRLSDHLTIEDEIQSENENLSITQVRNICGTLMFSGDDSQKKISLLSGGEKARVMLGKILAYPSNLLLLDEPTNHLDQESVSSLIKELKNFKGAVVIVTHSEEILSELPNKFVVFRENNCEEFIGNYDDFLEKIGWESEGGVAVKKKKKMSKKEIQQQRQVIIQKRSKELKPKKERLERLEKIIITEESNIEKMNEELIQASENSQGDLITELSRKIKESQSKIDDSFEELELLSNELEDLEKQFEQQINNLEN